MSVVKDLRIVLVLALALGCSCDGGSAGAEARLVVLYVPCTVQKHQLAPDDPRVRFTPKLAEFARESWVFERHTTEAEQSGPAFASIFTGAQSDRHGAYDHPAKLPPDLYQVSEAFADAGWETWFWSGHPMASAELDYGQGVPADRVRRPRAANLRQLAPEEALSFTANDPSFENLLERLRADPGLRAFVQIGFTITHGPYSYYCTPQAIADFCELHPEECGGLTAQQIARYLKLYEDHYLQLQWNNAATMREMGLSPQEQAEFVLAISAVYKTTVHELDRLFGMFVDKIKERGLWHQSLIAFTSDHGELLYRDNALFQWTHGLQLAPESLDVPLIVHLPGPEPQARRYEQVTRSIDVFPTLAGLLSIPLPADAGIEGVNLAPVLRGDERAPDLLAFSHTTTLTGTLLAGMRVQPPVVQYFSTGGVDQIWVRVRDGDLVCKLRNLGGEQWIYEVFDLAADPEERVNLYDASDGHHAALAAALREYKARLVAAHARTVQRRALSEEEHLERLRSLGYVE